MKRFKNILLVADFNSKHHTAVDRAVSLARQNGASLTVIAVVKQIPADMQMAIAIVTPGELLDMVIDDCRKKVDALDRHGMNVSPRLRNRLIQERLNQMGQLICE